MHFYFAIMFVHDSDSWCNICMDDVTIRLMCFLFRDSLLRNYQIRNYVQISISSNWYMIIYLLSFNDNRRLLYTEFTRVHEHMRSDVLNFNLYWSWAAVRSIIINFIMEIHVLFAIRFNLYIYIYIYIQLIYINIYISWINKCTLH